MANDKLKDAAIRKAKPGEKPRKLSDGGGDVLGVAPERREILAPEVPDHGK